MLFITFETAVDTRIFIHIKHLLGPSGYHWDDSLYYCEIDELPLI